MPITSSGSSSSAEPGAVGPRPTRPPSGQAGFTIGEMMVSMLLFSVISLAFYQIFIGTMRTNMLLESNNDLTTLGQRAVNDVKEEILQAKVLYQDDARGQSYLANLGIPSINPVLAGSLLPVADPEGSFTPDSTTRHTGNSLLLLREQVPASYWIDDDGDGGTPDVEVLSDQYTFEYLYLSPNPTRNFEGQGHYLDLVLARSDPYASYVQLAGMTATARAAVAAALLADGIDYAVDPWQDADQAFYQIGAGGTLTGPASHPIILGHSDSLLPEFRGGRISGNMTYSVGPQTDPPLPGADPIGLYAQPNGSFPGGLESQIVGSSSSRKVLVRLVLLASHSNRLTSQVNVVTSTTSEF